MRVKFLSRNYTSFQNLQQIPILPSIYWGLQFVCTLCPCLTSFRQWNLDKPQRNSCATAMSRVTWMGRFSTWLRYVNMSYSAYFWVGSGRDPFNQYSDRSDREKRTTSKGGPVFSKLFRLDRTDPLSFGPKFPEILVEWIAPSISAVSRVRSWSSPKRGMSAGSFSRTAAGNRA